MGRSLIVVFGLVSVRTGLFLAFLDFSGPVSPSAAKRHTHNGVTRLHVLLYGAGVCALWALIPLFVSDLLR